MLWYKEIGFNTNPFSIKPAPFDFKIIGYDTKEIFEKIKRGEILFIEGSYGYGKTTILKSIINEFGGSREVVYYNCNRSEDINVKTLLQGKYNAFGRLLKLMPKDMVLLLDEVEKLKQQDQSELYDFFKEGNIKSILFFGPSFEKTNFSIELKKLMVNNVLELTKLTPEEAVELVRERVGNIKMLSDAIVKKVYSLSQNNPRLMLENLEDLSRYAIENNDDEVTEEHIKEVLKIKEKKPRKIRKKKKTNKPKKKSSEKPVKKKQVEEQAEEPNDNIFVEEIDQPEKIEPEPGVYTPEIEEIDQSEEPEYFY